MDDQLWFTDGAVRGFESGWAMVGLTGWNAGLEVLAEPHSLFADPFDVEREALIAAVDRASKMEAGCSVSIFTDSLSNILSLLNP